MLPTANKQITKRKMITVTCLAIKERYLLEDSLVPLTFSINQKYDDKSMTVKLCHKIVFIYK